MRTETVVPATDPDPQLTAHCGCGVPFTEHCPACEDYLGADTYHRPDEPVLRRERKGEATYFYDGDLHVGTVRRKAKGHYEWLTRFTVGQKANYDDAIVAMRKELGR
jgi:hypothetical protein